MESDRLIMIRENLENIPCFEPPEGYSLRWYQPGDEVVWRDIQRQADAHNQITPGLFREQFEAESGQLEKRQCYLIEPGGRPIGTATAWFDDKFEGGVIGRLHWVAVVPRYRGRGLSKPLMTVVCQRLRELGHRRAYLTTSVRRTAAIQLYLRFGFEPLIRGEEKCPARQAP